jgi:hypothetical protein
MSSWHPTDLVTDQDLLDYERSLPLIFGENEQWAAQRTKALEDWLFPTLKGQGLEPQRLRTRFVPSEAYSHIASAYADVTTAASDITADDLNLATIFATAGSDRLYVASTEPFRGLFVRIHDEVSSATSALTVKYWNGRWKALAIADGTAAVSGKTLSAGGSVTWTLPVDWATRPVNGSGLRYWAQLSVSATPTGAKAAQIATIRRSALCAPATLRTLAMIFREAPAAQEGPWREKAEYYESEADAALQRALRIVGGEFDTVIDDDVIDAEEQAQTLEAAGGGWRLERG